MTVSTSYIKKRQYKVQSGTMPPSWQQGAVLSPPSYGVLQPDDFGLLALGMIAILSSDTIDDLGVADAMVYRQNDPSVLTMSFVINLLDYHHPGWHPDFAACC
jgi:hypothetical protein